MTTTDNATNPTSPETDSDETSAQPADSEAVDSPTTDATPAVAVSHDPDAAVGAKTRKDGRIERFFGYHEHTLVQVPGPGVAADAEPRLINRFELTPASADIVDVSLSLLDRLDRPAEELIVDRHYHYKKPERWRDELATRDIDQIHDLRVDEHGFTELEHTRWAAGWPHCPATPDTYGVIERPGPTTDRSTDTKWQEFDRRIAERAAYAFRRVTSPDIHGAARWECPAAAGQIGCPLRAGTVEAAVTIGQPIIENPPDPTSADAPLCCKQRTVTLDPGPLRKLMQTLYWGGPAWEAEWSKRTYVEGSYGNRKNASTENLRRGHFRVTGLTLVHILTAMAAASYNLRMLRGWHERTGLGDPDHPLLQAEDEPAMFLRLSPEEYDRYCAEYLRGGEPEEPSLTR
jgi:hypothetical protein